MLLNASLNARGASSALDGVQSGGAALHSDAGLPISGQTLGFLPSARESLLRTSAYDDRGGPGVGSTSGAAAGNHPAGLAANASLLSPAALTTTAPLVQAADLVERSAFLYGLLHSDRIVQDVHDAIASVTAAASTQPRSQSGDADNDGDDDSSVPADHSDVSDRPRRRQPRRGGAPVRGHAGPLLSGVFYFAAQPPWLDMPWRPTYKSAVLLCVFASTAACQQALARLGVAATSGCGAGTALTAPLPVSSTALTTTAAAPRLVLRPAADEAVLNSEDVRTALLTFLTGPQLTSVLQRCPSKAAAGANLPQEGPARSRLAFPSLLSADGAAAEVRRLSPSPRLVSSAARLYAALLSPQSPYQVDWVAAHDAVKRGDGIVVPELVVLGPWVGSGGQSDAFRGLEDRRDGTRVHDHRGGSAESGRASTPFHTASGSGEDGLRRGDARTPWPTAVGSLPLTLQEEDYRKRYGVAPQGRPGSYGVGPYNNSSGGTSGSGGGDDSGDGVAGLMPSRSSLYRGSRHVFRAVAWVVQRLREGLGDEEAPLIGGPGGAAATLAAPPLPPSLLSGGGGGSGGGAPLSSANAASALLSGERGLEEPPRQRHRSEGGGGGGEGSGWLQQQQRQRGAAMVIPRYNAVGTALSWMPGFQYFGGLFVTSTTVLTPQGATRSDQARQQRRRPRDDGEGASGGHPAWESLMLPRYTDATTTGQPPISQKARPPAVHDSVLSWTSPNRGTSWPPPPPPSWFPAGQLPPSTPYAAPVSTSVGEEPGVAATHNFYPSAASAPATTRSASHSIYEPSQMDEHPRLHRSGIRVESVRSQSAGGDEDVDNISFGTRHRHRHISVKSNGVGGDSAASAGSVASAVPRLNMAMVGDDGPAGGHASPHGAHLSLAAGLRKMTQDAREDRGEVRHPVTPHEPKQRIPGIVEASAKGSGAAGGAANTSTRSGQKTVSFVLPDDKSLS